MTHAFPTRRTSDRGDGINDPFVGVTANAGKATSKGVEFEGNAVLAEDFAGLGSTINLAATAGYIDAKYDRFVDAFGTDVASQRAFQNTPKWTLSGRSEEHTSELQSLMRISYAVFCLQKKNKKQPLQNNIQPPQLH